MEKLKDSDIDQAIIDEYEIGETLGTGHFSKVKLGINRKTGEKVAIKVLPPTSRRSRCRRAALGVWTSGAQPAPDAFAQIIVKPTGSKIAMLKTEVDIMTKTEHPNVYAPLPRPRAKPPTPEAVHTRLSAESSRRLLTRRAMGGSVKLYKVHETTTVLYLVMELLTGGELFDRIVARGHYSEDDARKLTVVMLKAVLSASPRNTRSIPQP